VSATVVRLPVPHFSQEQGYYCGPACAGMVLSFWGSWLSQDTLWATIKSKTQGSRPNGAPPTPGHFPNQQCYHCGLWHCWDTAPEALAAALNAHGPWFAPVNAYFPSTIDATIISLIGSINAAPSRPPCATFYGVNHWVVITGYHLDDLSLPDAPPFPVGTFQLNGMYFQNPNSADADAVFGWMPTAAFRQVLGPISCGPHLDRYPIVTRPQWNWFAIIWRYITLKISSWWGEQSP
jgi:hypothetical protein